MSLEPIASRLQTRLIIADGAMGTWLLSRGAWVSSCVELLNVDDPDAVERAHREYLAAGAQLIESNTFASNRVKLGKHELTHHLAEINEAGVRIARRAAGDVAYVAGSVGPLGALLAPFGGVDRARAHEFFAEHIAAVAAGSPDLLLLETFGNVEEALLALAAAKETHARLPTIVSLSVLEDGKTPGGDPLLSAFRRLRNAGADGLGINCAAGPQVVYDALAPIIGEIDCPVSVMPNAGYPERIDDRAVYRSTPTYFAEFARKFASIGANIVGGCCGTTPEHIKAMAVELNGKRIAARAAAGLATRAPESVSAAEQLRADSPDVEAVPARPLTNFERKLGREFVVTVELSPPRGIDYRSSLGRARQFELAGADAVNIPDNPTARLRLSSVALAHLVMRETKLATILHISSRDRNLLALQSELLGAAALGVTGILALTGDPNTFGDFPKATSVFDVTALGLAEIVNALNHGRDHAGNDVGSPTRFRIGAAVNPGAKDLDAELARLSAKLDAGADFVITQPVFDLESLRGFLGRVESFEVPIIAGLLVLRGAQNAEFLHNEVPGVTIPDDIRARLHGATDDAAEAVAVARELLAELSRTRGVAGAFIIPQDRYEETADIVRALRATAVAAS